MKQPWAFLLINGIKTLEVRSWTTSYRGQLLICASASPKNIFWRDNSSNLEVVRLLPSGCIHGVVILKNCRKMKQSDEFKGGALSEYQQDAFVWEIEVPEYRPCRPDKIVGRLGLFEVPDDKIIYLDEGDDFYNYSPPQGKVKLTPKCKIV